MTYTPHHLWAYFDLTHPMVAWSVYMGRVDSVGHRVTHEFKPVSLRHAALLAGFMQGDPDRLIAELRLEVIRAADFPDHVSRLTGLYLFEDRDAAQRAAARWAVPGSHFDDPWLTEVGFAATQLTRVDSEWITTHFHDPDPGWMRAYWQGDPLGADPIWEVLAEGAGTIWGTDQRHEAWDRCAAAFPDSLLLLDACRVAQEVGDFNFGRVVPFIMRVDETARRLDYLMDWRDAKNPAMLDAIGSYDGPRNASIQPGEEVQLVLPDLRPFGFDFTMPTGTVYPHASTGLPDHGSP